MGFYQQISRYYDDIFGLSQDTIDFFNKILDDHDLHTVLDVACGSGSLIAALADKGYQTAGTDLDPAMVTLAREKASERSRDFWVTQGDMQTISHQIHDAFDCVICMGNSLVHLENENAIQSTLNGFRELTSEKKGYMILQIINFDRVLDKQIKALPTIHNDKAGLNFERNYDCSSSENKIHFNTRLYTPEGVFENSVPLYPLRKDALAAMIANAGFTSQVYYGSFQRSPWNPDSYATIVVAHR